MEVILSRDSMVILAELIAEKLSNHRNKPEQFVSIGEVSKHFNIPVGTIYKMTSQSKNKIPHIKKGKLLFKISEVEKWLSAKR